LANCFPANVGNAGRIQSDLTLRQADQARSDFAALSDDLDFIKEQLARLPTRKDQARLALLALVGGAGLTAGLMLAAFWH
jgi:hypothetical protein